MKVSVIIPAYNEEQMIATCIQHVLNQKEKADEILVIDNNSKDKTPEIIKNYPVTYILEKEQGIIPARNKGFNEAKGDIIARTDADTRVPLDWIEKIKKDFTENDILAVTGPVTFYDLPVNSPLLSNMFTYELKVMFNQYLLFGPNFAIKKSLWDIIKEKVCLNAKEVHEDFDLALHVPDPQKNVFFDPHLVVPISARRIKSHP
ncbi:MAG TPA: glycosyltransferase family 2 protein, partial [Candidatus Woesebacteria bacterium]|nr:glycosyltransferase family 2 protein [Candidatus Woesebacteria bacterium]